ncbi:MAG: RAMP superfamily CRISPR-associated protein [Thermostichus sp. DRC_bins_24]
MSPNSVSWDPSSAPEAFTLRIKMLSDWHIGTGAGRTGEVDSLVIRDPDGLPYLPAKTLTGIWRDACEKVAYGLDGGTEGSWSDWVNFLFGDQPAQAKGPVATAPRPAALGIRSARLPQVLREAMQGRPLLQEAITFIKPGVSIDLESGCAREDFLRFEEMVRAGAILEAHCQLDPAVWGVLDVEYKAAAQALLWTSTRLFEHLGGKRRRGSGRCEVSIQTPKGVVNIDSIITWLESHSSCPPVPEPGQVNSITFAGNSNLSLDPDEAWIRIPVTLTTETPLIIAKQTIGNIIETLDYIPGSHLVPLVSKRLPHAPWIHQAIADGLIILTNATPAKAEQKSLPVPFALFGEKLDGGLEKGKKVYNRLVEAETEATGQLKSERKGYIIPKNGSLPDHITLSTSLYTHNTIDDDVQRPTEDGGGVYSYQAIPPKTELQAELRMPQAMASALKQEDPNWIDRLGAAYSFGRSKKDDYGQVSVRWGQQATITTPAPLTSDQAPSTLTVWLLSDVLMRDERLRPTTDIKVLARLLGTALGSQLALREAKGLMSSGTRTHRHESWQSRWGLPRPSLVGLGAGSCFVFEMQDKPIDPQKLRLLEITGIGERRAEGFGQVYFNHPLLMNPTSKLTRERPEKSSQQPKKGPLMNSATNKDYARVIEKAAWRTAIQRKVLEIVKTAAGRKQCLGISDSEPSLSQLGSLRSVVNRLVAPESDGNVGGVLEWLSHLENVPNRKERKEKWPSDCRNQIRRLVSDANLIWTLLALNEDKITLTEGGSQSLRRELWAEAVKTLVDGCIRARRRDTESIQASELVGV